MTTIDRTAPIRKRTFGGLRKELGRLRELGQEQRYTRGWTAMECAYGIRYRESHFRQGSGLSFCGMDVSARRLLCGDDDEGLAVCPVCLERYGQRLSRPRGRG